LADKLTGAKPPLSAKHVWAVRTRLQLLKRYRDLALFDLAIDSKLRGCDLVGLRIADVAPHGYAVDRASVRQRKTGRPVRFEVTEQTRQAIDDYLSQWRETSNPYLFPARCPAGHLTARQYARLLARWLAMIGLDPSLYGMHYLRRTKATLIYKKREIFERFSFYWATRRSRARSAISEYGHRAEAVRSWASVLVL
jgi:integrase